MELKCCHQLKSAITDNKIITPDASISVWVIVKKKYLGSCSLKKRIHFHKHQSIYHLQCHSTYYNPYQCTVLSMHVFISKVSIAQVLAEDPLCTVYKV